MCNISTADDDFPYEINSFLKISITEISLVETAGSENVKVYLLDRHSTAS